MHSCVFENRVGYDGYDGCLHVTLHPKRVWSTVVQPPPWLDSSLCTSATILDLFAMHSALCFLHLPQISENHLHNIILPGTVSCLLAMRQPCTQHFNVSAFSFFVQHHTIRYSVHSDVWEVRGLMILWYGIAVTTAKNGGRRRDVCF